MDGSKVQTQQLLLPHVWDEVHLPHTGGACVAMQLLPWGLRLHLDLPRHVDTQSERPTPCCLRRSQPTADPQVEEPCERRDLTIRVTSPARISGWLGALYALLPDLVDDPAVAALDRESVTSRIVAAQRDFRGRSQANEVARVADLIGRGVDHLRRLSDDDALRRARAFVADRATRVFIYAALVNDQTGRVAQMTEVCPGLLLAASGFDAVGHSDDAEEIVEAIRRGEKLGKILTSGVAAWSAQIARQGHPIPKDSLRFQRQRIRWAGKQVRPQTLMEPCLPGLVVSDIPPRDDAENNARWYEVTRLAVVRFREDDDANTPRLSPRCLHAFGGFLSVNWSFFETAWFGLYVYAAIDRLLTDLRLAKRCPHRQSDPQSILRDLMAFYAYEGTPEGFFRGREHGAIPTRPPPKTKLWTDAEGESVTQLGDDTLSPLTTFCALIDEGRAMNHCVATYVAEAVLGEAQFFHAIIDGAHLTVMVDRTGTEPQINAVYGNSNREPSPDEFVTIEMLFLARRDSEARSCQPPTHRPQSP